MKQPHENSCQHCRHLRTDSECDDGGNIVYSIDYCAINENYVNLKSFPFKTDRPCFKIDFWTAIVRDEELRELWKQYEDGGLIGNPDNIYSRFNEKYP